MRPIYYREAGDTHRYDEDLEPFASLFLKPLSNRKSAFSKRELELMCKDPLHSPRLILYLIDYVKDM
jgi:hypothetical protein